MLGVLVEEVKKLSMFLLERTSPMTDEPCAVLGFAVHQSMEFLAIVCVSETNRSFLELFHGQVDPLEFLLGADLLGPHLFESIEEVLLVRHGKTSHTRARTMGNKMMNLGTRLPQSVMVNLVQQRQSDYCSTLDLILQYVSHDGIYLAYGFPLGPLFYSTMDHNTIGSENVLMIWCDHRCGAALLGFLNEFGHVQRKEFPICDA